MAKPAEKETAGGALAIRLFGQMEMRLDGVPVKFGAPRKALEILAYVLLNRAAVLTIRRPELLEYVSRSDFDVNGNLDVFLDRRVFVRGITP